MPPRIHLGINTCFAVKRWPEPEAWIALVREDLRLQHCQFCLDLVDPFLDAATTWVYAESARRRATEAGLEIHSTFSGLAAYSWSQLLHPDAGMRAAALRWYKRAIDFTAALGAKATGGYMGAFSVRDAADHARRGALLVDLGSALADLTLYARGRGLQDLLVENMAAPREWGYTIEQAHALTAMGAPAGAPITLCLDIGHPCALGTGTASDDPLAWLHEHWARTPVLHLQQTDRGSDRHWPFTSSHNAGGIIRPEPVLDAILQWPAGDVFLFLEVIHPFEAPDELVLSEVRESVAYWRTAIEARLGTEAAPAL